MIRLKDSLNRLRSSDGYLYAGYPRYMGLYGRDSLISSWQLLRIDSSIARCSLAALARAQGTEMNKASGEEPGKILNEYYPKGTSKKWFRKYKSHLKWLKYGSPAYFSVDSTPLFLIVLSYYHKTSRDSGFVREIWPHALRAVKWMLRYGIRDSFLRYDVVKSKDKGLLSQSWKDGNGSLFEKIAGPVAAVEAQGYLYAALDAAGQLADAVHDDELSHEMRERAAAVKAAFDQAFWNDDNDYYSIALDGKGRMLKNVSSNPGHLLFTGILSKEKARAVVKRLFKNDLWTPYGIRTLSTEDRHFNEASYQNGSVWPHDNWIIAQGLRSMGYEEEYLRVRDSMLAAHSELGVAAEYYCVSRKNKLLQSARLEKAPCIPQAWSVGALMNLLYSERETLTSSRE